MSKAKSGDLSPRADRAAKAKARKSKKNGTLRQQKLLKGLVDGKSTRAASLEAGYSVHTAAQPEKLLDTKFMRERIAQLIVPVEHLAQRINEGVDAMVTEFAKFKGRITDSKACVDFEQRRKYVELAAKLKGITVDDAFQPFAGMVPKRVVVEFVNVEQLGTA